LASKEYELRSEALELLKFWRDARGEFALPHRNALDPIRLKKWINNLSIVEYRANEERYFVKLHSSFTQDCIGQNMTRAYFDDVLSADALSVALQPYEAARAARKPTLSVIMPQLYPNLFKRLDRMVLPFTDQTPSDPDATVDRFVTWVGPSTADTKIADLQDLKASGKTLNLTVIDG